MPAARFNKAPLLRRVGGWLVRIAKWGLVLTLGFMATSTLLVLLLRWAPVPVSAVEIQRGLEARLDGRPHAVAAGAWVGWENISPSIPRAVVAAEDQRFFEHFGFDLVQLQKAIDDSRRGKRLRGASTITQQTAKNLFLWHGRSVVRKGLEAWFTLLMELLWSKQRILEVYLNVVEFGPGIYGVDAASQSYFRASPALLNQYQAALLAAVLPNPHRMHVTRPSPYVLERQRWILSYMDKLALSTHLPHPSN